MQWSVPGRVKKIYGKRTWSVSCHTNCERKGVEKNHMNAVRSNT